jgi:xylan 1,4-beta-xylosidase
MASGEKTVFHYRANITPPKDYDRRYQLMQKLASHCVDRYGVEEVRSWFFEVWNEPNLEAFGTGKKEDYFKLYKCTVDAIKSVDTHLTVGGPATVADAWITDFGEFCQSNKAQLDFISTHHHPIDTFGKPGDETETQFAASRRSILRDQAQAVVGEARGKPVYYTEWSSSSNPWDQLLDESYAAAFAVKSILEVDELVNGYGYWTFLDIFEENYFPSVPFPGSFWLLNIHGIPKPVYRVYEVLHGLGNELLQVKGSHSTTNVWAVKGSDSLVLLATNYALPRHDTGTEKVRIKIDSIVSSGRAVIARIDDDHANAPRVWREMGNPEYLSGPQLQVLYAASELDHSEQQFQHHGKIAEFEIVIPPQGVAAVTLADIKADHA